MCEVRQRSRSFGNREAKKRRQQCLRRGHQRSWTRKSRCSHRVYSERTSYCSFRLFTPIRSDQIRSCSGSLGRLQPVAPTCVRCRAVRAFAGGGPVQANFRVGNLLGGSAAVLPVTAVTRRSCTSEYIFGLALRLFRDFGLAPPSRDFGVNPALALPGITSMSLIGVGRRLLLPGAHSGARPARPGTAHLFAASVFLLSSE